MLSAVTQDELSKLLFPRFTLLQRINVRHTNFFPLLPLIHENTDPTKNKTVKPILDEASKEILAQKKEVTRLASVASKHPFYKYNSLWSRELQNFVRWNLSFPSYEGRREERTNLAPLRYLGLLHRVLRVARWLP